MKYWFTSIHFCICSISYELQMVIKKKSHWRKRCVCFNKTIRCVPKIAPGTASNGHSKNKGALWTYNRRLFNIHLVREYFTSAVAELKSGDEDNSYEVPEALIMFQKEGNARTSFMKARMLLHSESELRENYYIKMVKSSNFWRCFDV